MAEFVIPNGQAIAERRLAKGILSQEKLAQLSRLHKSDNVGSSRKFRSLSLDSIKLAEQSKEVGVWILESLAELLECNVQDLLPRYSLLGCHQDFATWHAGHPSGRKLKFTTIGIDMVLGWENIAAAIEFSKGNHTDFQILMLTADASLLPSDAPEEVRAWTQGAGAHFRMIERVLKTFTPTKRVSMEFKHYASLPTIHGMRVNYGELPPRYYLSECGVRPGELKIYGWGEGEYMIADFDSKRTYCDYRLMMGRFERKFHEQWESLPTSLSFDSVTH